MKKKLYIIGNGFDLAHKIESGYDSFYDFLDRHKYVERDLKDMGKIWWHLEVYSAPWNHFETELAKFDTHDLCLSYDMLDDETVIDDTTLINMVSTNSFDDKKKTVETLKRNFRSWVEAIEIGDCDKKRIFEKESVFLTFNYTETLEKLYNIKSKHICHIHEKVGRDLVFGHRWDENVNDESFSNSFEEYMHGVYKEQVIAPLYKNCEDIIDKYECFFSKMILNVSQIEIMGHSLSEVDMPYFEEIYKNIGKKVPWIFYYHSEDDKNNINKFIEKFKLNDISKVLESGMFWLST